MKLLIEVKDKEMSISFFKEGEIRDRLTWQDNNNLSLSLLKNIDKILTRNKTNIMDLQKSEVNIKSAGLSTERILKAVSETVDYCLTK